MYSAGGLHMSERQGKRSKKAASKHRAKAKKLKLKKTNSKAGAAA